jgi:hypothetical protein
VSPAPAPFLTSPGPASFRSQTYTAGPAKPVQVVYGGNGPVTLENRDTASTVVLGADEGMSADDSSIGIIDPLGSVQLDGTSDVWALTTGGTAACQAIGGANGLTPGAIQIAASIATSGLAVAIADAVALAGVPLVALPVAQYTSPALGSVAAGATVTVPPAAGGTQAGVSGSLCYDVALAFESGTGTTFPFVLVSVFFFDASGTHALSEELWICPMSATGGITVRGSGPVRGTLMQVNIQNLDSVAMTVPSFVIWTSSRPQNGSDWRHNPAIHTPGYLAPTAGQGNDNCLGALNAVSLLAGATQNYLLGMFSGNIYVRANAQGGSGAATVNFALRALEDTSGLNTLVSIQSGNNDPAEVSLIAPRGPLWLQVVSSEATLTTTLNFIAVAQPIA